MVNNTHCSSPCARGPNSTMGGMSFQDGNMSYAEDAANHSFNRTGGGGGIAGPSRAGSPSRTTKVTRVEKTPTGMKRTTSETKVYSAAGTQTGRAANSTFQSAANSTYQTAANATYQTAANATFQTAPNATYQAPARADGTYRAGPPQTDHSLEGGISYRAPGPQAFSTPNRNFIPYSLVTEPCNYFADWSFNPDATYDVNMAAAPEPSEAQDFSGLSYLDDMQDHMLEVTPPPANASMGSRMDYLDRLDDARYDAVNQEFDRRLNQPEMDLSFYDRQRMHLVEALRDLELRYAMERDMLQEGYGPGMTSRAPMSPSRAPRQTMDVQPRQNRSQAKRNLFGARGQETPPPANPGTPRGSPRTPAQRNLFGAPDFNLLMNESPPSQIFEESIVTEIFDETPPPDLLYSPPGSPPALNRTF